jgi:hypothetical protein
MFNLYMSFYNQSQLSVSLIFFNLTHLSFLNKILVSDFIYVLSIIPVLDFFPDLL